MTRKVKHKSTIAAHASEENEVKGKVITQNRTLQNTDAPQQIINYNSRY